MSGHPPVADVAVLDDGKSLSGAVRKGDVDLADFRIPRPPGARVQKVEPVPPPLKREFTGTGNVPPEHDRRLPAIALFVDDPE